jgi:small subunit ribosomal protein S4
MYGVLERQFRNYFKKASQSEGVTGEALLRFLECRLDNVVYRLGFASSRSAARLMVLHNHILLNENKVNIPSLQVEEGDVITVKEKSRGLESIHNSLKGVGEVPEWLALDKVKLSGSVVRLPDRESMPSDINEQLVIELYSK